MENLFKKFLHTGVGFVSIATEKFKKAIDELVKDGKMSETEGEKIVTDFAKKSEDHRKEFEKEFGEAVEKVIKNLKFAKKEEYDKLIKRVENLEKLITEKFSAEGSKKTSQKKKKTDDKDIDADK